MPRPKKNRVVKSPPLFKGFKPIGIPMNKLEQLSLTLDEYEAIRLADYKGLDHSQASVRMDISRSTFTRLVEKARGKIARLIIEGKAIVIEGGNIHFRGNIIKCSDCGNIIPNNFQSNVTQCTECGSQNLEDFAGRFGHGKCCRKHHGNS